MKAKNFRIFFLILLVVAASAGVLKGCNSEEYPKQLSLSAEARRKVNTEHPFKKDSTIKVPAGPHYKKNKFMRFLLGSHYRKLWLTPVEMPLFDIQQSKGKMKVIKRGGNMQTLNLRMESESGKRYVLRSIDKDQSKALPSYTKNKITTFLIRDQTSALNPYGALIIPGLAEAAGIYHTNPELYFIPYDPNFGQYADLFEGRVALLEEFPDETWLKDGRFGKPDDIASSTSLLLKRYSSHDVIIDEKAFARARLFDLLINDWDRHTDQWKWAVFEKDGKHIYKPIPRDRDAAFFRFDTGVIPHMVLLVNPKFQTFDDEYGNVNGLVKNAKYIDKLILNSITEQEMLAIAQELQSSLTDSIIESAVKKLPSEIYSLIGEETIGKLKLRRNKLQSAAKDYYKILFKEVKIIGTDGNEEFIVERIDNHHTQVTILDGKKNSYFSHVYDHRHTKDIYLHGLDGEDEFLLKGKVDKGITIHIYGGENRDEVKDESVVKGYIRKTKVYDYKGDNFIEGNRETEDLTSNDPLIMFFDRSGMRK